MKMRFASLPKAVPAALALAALSACSPAPVATGYDDPNEGFNRSIHDLNVAIDKVALKPASVVYGAVVPPPAKRGVSNFAHNLSLPGMVVNDILQGDIGDAFHNFMRFAVNSTIGLGGLIDVGTPNELEERPTDFGETLHVWGMGEGDYVVLPVFGPSTERDALGTVVDIAMNPVSLALPAEYRSIPTYAQVAGIVHNRYTYSGTFDAVLYEGEDPYLSAMLFYLDSRRFELSGDSATDELYDLYEDMYDE